MPVWVHGKDKDKWEKAKEIVKKEYSLSEEDGDRFWALVTGVYKKMGGRIKSSSEGLNRLDVTSLILEGLKVNENNVPVGMRMGDKIKILRRGGGSSIPIGSVWVCASEHKPGKNSLFYRLKKNGELASITNTNNIQGMSLETFNKLLKSEFLIAMGPDEDVNDNTIDIKELRRELSKMGLAVWTGVTSTEMVRSKGSFLVINVKKKGGEILPIAFVRAIGEFLDKKGYKHDMEKSIKKDTDGKEFYASYTIYVDKYFK